MDKSKVPRFFINHGVQSALTAAVIKLASFCWMCVILQTLWKINVTETYASHHSHCATTLTTYTYCFKQNKT